MKAVEIEGIEPEIAENLSAMELGKARAYVILYDPQSISIKEISLVCSAIGKATDAECIAVREGSIRVLKVL